MRHTDCMYVQTIIVVCVNDCAGLRKTSNKYAEKQVAGKTLEKTMFDLAWDVEELSRVDDIGRKLIVDCSALAGKLLQPGYNRVTDNFARMLCTFRDKATQFSKRAVKYRRTPATHVLVVMISPEERSKKPYALPVQCMAYDSLGDEAVRSISNKLVNEMATRRMKVAGESRAVHLFVYVEYYQSL